MTRPAYRGGTAAGAPIPLDITASVYYYCGTVSFARGLHVDPAAAAPLWSQIEDGMRRLVASGGLTAGAGVPSVRDLARELRVNPATVSKAYQHLADAGVLEVRRGDGTYVSTTAPSVSRGQRSRALREAALRYASLAATLGVDREEALDELRAAWSELMRGRKGAPA
jgi:GntR family transcriptional regulator